MLAPAPCPLALSDSEITTIMSAARVLGRVLINAQIAAPPLLGQPSRWPPAGTENHLSASLRVRPKRHCVGAQD
jgi:hypothetical protein